MAAAACQVETSYTDTNNLSNSSETRTYSANYALGGGVTIGVVYFDVEQTANSLTRTDVDGYDKAFCWLLSKFYYLN